MTKSCVITSQHSLRNVVGLVHPLPAGADCSREDGLGLCSGERLKVLSDAEPAGSRILLLLFV
jgi:hypothetical protein